MNIGIIGAGRMAGALGANFAKAGHQLRVGARNPEAAADLAQKLGGGTAHGDIANAARFGEVILLAVKRSGITEALAAAGDLRGKPLIDCNNLGPDPEGGISIAETIRQESGASVVKAFNCCHFHVWRMSPPVFDGRRLAVPYCGDDSVAKACARALIEQMGCRPLDLGGLGKALHIEYLAAIVIGLLFGGADPNTVFNLVDATDMSEHRMRVDRPFLEQPGRVRTSTDRP
ncbi:MAG TPA: NAD(P)-binding domain-containing protein [Solirubrobacteraceae bacterium]|nr:NAD(P)-binding domain-containing protein [Solirubrobacteraceae bacterium]